MTVYNFANVNTNFYDYSAKKIDNSVMTEYTSGRKVGYLKNTKNAMTIECSLLLTKTETATFWTWFDGIGGVTGIFKCSALGSGNYRFLEVPSPTTSQEWTTLAMTIEEV